MILTLTLNPTIDKSCNVERVEPDRKLRCKDVRRDPGGGGLNVARAVHKLGGSALAIWACGGPAGDVLADLLDEEGVEHRPFPIGGMTRENLIIHDRSSDRSYRFGMPGPELSEEDGERFLEEVRKQETDYIAGSGSLPPGLGDDFYARLARLSGEMGARFVVDASGEPLRLAIDAGVWLAKPNMRELSTLAERELADESEVVSAASEIIERGKAHVLLVSLGAGGALLVTRDAVEHIPSPAVRIRSRVGAGDSTVAGFVLALDRGRSVRDAARFGVAAGAAAVMTPGSDLCRREDAERLYERIHRGEA